MQRIARRTALALFLLAGFCPTARAADEKPAASGAKKKVVFLAGGRSHGFFEHDHLSGCHLLAARVSQVPGFEGVVYKGWPTDKSAFDGAAAVVMYSDGGGGHFAIPRIKDLDALHEKGVGIGAIHYAVEVPKGKAGDAWLKWMGGYFEINWSVNPHWEGTFAKFPADHPVARGLQPFVSRDEWYYNMRFRENMEGVTPVLSAVPPDRTRQGKDDAHGGNPEVRKYVGQNRPEHVLWVSENKNGSRGFGTTGGHFHANWANDNFRKAVLNSIVWTAKGEVPANGIDSPRPTMDELLSNQDQEPPANFDKEKWAKEIEAMNRPRQAAAR
jgi:hypothetical protein